MQAGNKKAASRNTCSMSGRTEDEAACSAYERDAQGKGELGGARTSSFYRTQNFQPTAETTS
jgi:hypothetical protein